MAAAALSAALTVAAAAAIGGSLAAPAAYGLRAAPAAATHAGGAISQSQVNQVTTTPPGYVLAAADGGVFAYGRAFHGSAAGLALRAPISGIASTPDGGGYWLVAADGGVFAYGDAHFYGSMSGITLNAPVEGIAATPDGHGYWLVASDGGVFAFGDAPFHDRLQIDIPVVGIASTGDGNGYFVLTDTGDAFAFGDALAIQQAPREYGYVGIAHVPGTARGVAIVDVAGTRFNYSAADVGCPTSSVFPQAIEHAGIAGIAATTRCGEWLVGWDGGVYAFGAPFFGSAATLPLVSRIVGIAS